MRSKSGYLLNNQVAFNWLFDITKFYLLHKSGYLLNNHFRANCLNWLFNITKLNNLVI